MPMDASIGVSSRTKSRFDDFHDSVIPEKRQTDALSVLLDIAAEEGYWDEDDGGRGPSHASRAELVSRIEDTETTLEKHKEVIENLDQRLQMVESR